MEKLKKNNMHMRTINYKTGKNRFRYYKAAQMKILPTCKI